MLEPGWYFLPDDGTLSKSDLEVPTVGFTSLLEQKSQLEVVPQNAPQCFRAQLEKIQAETSVPLFPLCLLQWKTQLLSNLKDHQECHQSGFGASFVNPTATSQPSRGP